jgi:putative protease
MCKIELLSPARDAEIGIEAFNHGADAVYIGAPRFSARAAAGCSVADIERLAAYGHRYGARTFVALNTILKNDELCEAERLIWQLYEAGVDALIVQDYGLLTLNLPPIELHASTQMDTRTVEKARLLKELGFTRVVMARELSAAQIRAIHEAVDVELECFVHGALCVSVSGQCYLSAALTGRSANRGACAQPCRLPMELLDARGNVIVRDKHLLSLKDMNRSAELETLIRSGVTSLKIEGRLKDMGYVKNVMAYYRRRLDALLEQHPDWQPLSDGRCTYTFEPRAAASFNRGFTNYYINGDRSTAEGRSAVIWNMDTPKSMGERIGTLGTVGRGWFILSGDATPSAHNGGAEEAQLHNGDGLVAQASDGKIYGFRLNKFDPADHRLYPAGGTTVTGQLRNGMTLYRNADYQFEQLLLKPSATRKIALDMSLIISASEATLQLTDERGNTLSQSLKGAFEPAKTPQRDNYRRQLSKLGDTPFVLRDWRVSVVGEGDYFIPSSLLSELRRMAISNLEQLRAEVRQRHIASRVRPDYTALAERLDARRILPTDYRCNVMNDRAADLLHRMKIETVAPAYELTPVSNAPVMFTAHCLKFALGYCPKYQKAKAPWQEPWSLNIGGRKFVLKFGCKNDCISELFATFATQNK